MKLAEHFSTDNSRNVVTLSEDAPEWLREATYAAHTGALPNDWVYEECREICNAVDDGYVTNEDDVHEYADGRVDIVTSDLYRWAADNHGTGFYSNAEEEAEDFGMDQGTIEKRLATIQYCAIRAIASTILAAYLENV